MVQTAKSRLLTACCRALSIDRRNTDGKDISLPGDKQQRNTAVESANSGRLDAPTGLTVTDAAGKAVAYTLTWQDGTVTVRVDAAFASLQMTYDALCWLHSHGMQTILFCTQECTASVSPWSCWACALRAPQWSGTTTAHRRLCG